MTTGDQKSRHKPSGKVTLEEVLKSLQDMIHTDLLEGAHVSQTPPAEKPDNTPGGEKQPKGREAPAIEDFASPSPASGPVNLGAVMRSLNDLMNNELNIGDEAGASDDAGSASQELREPESEINPEIKTSPAGAEDNLLDSLASLSEDVSFPETDAAPEPTSTTSEAGAVEFDTASEEIEAVPLPFDTLDTTVAPAGEIPVTSGTEDEASQTEQPAPESKRSGKNAPTGGLQQVLLLDEAPAHAEAPTVLESGGILAAAIDSDTEPASETTAPLESENIETVSTESPSEPESPPEFLEPDAVLEIPAIENPQAPSALDRAAMEMEIDAPAHDAQNTPAIDFDAITLDEPSEENAPAVPAAATLATESAPAPAADTVVHEIKMEAPVPQAVSMPSIDFNTVSPETPSEESQPAAPSSEPLALKNDSPVPSVEFSPSPSATPVAAPVESPKQPKLDDIPVLQDVVDSPTGKMAARELVAETPSPSPDRARDVIIRAVAKLNIELRKSGGSGLDPKLISRLQQYMCEELEKSAKKEE